MAFTSGSRRARAAALAGVVALCACTRLEDVAQGTVVTCGDASECPSGRVCNRGRCVNPAAIDTTPPDYVGTVAVAPARVRAGQAFTVTIEVTEALDGLPVVLMALVPPVPVECVAVAERRYACGHTPTGEENDALGGVISLDLRLRDLAGNDTARSGVAAVTLDFAPPSPKVAVVAYDPAPSSPLPAVRRAGSGTRVRVVVSADEALSTTSPPSLAGRLGAAGLTFAPSAEPDPGGNAGDAAFVTTLAGLEPDGAYTLAVTWADDLGNAGTVLVPATVQVKTSVPTLAVNQDALVFVRSPWGNAAPEDLGGYTIPAGPYFAVEPADPLAAGAALPAGALLLDGGEVPAAVLVRASPAANALVLGALRPDDAGRFPRQPLYSPDLAGVWLVGVDDAGNLSAPVKLRDAEWVVTPAPPAFGQSPHALVATGYARPTREQPERDAAVDRAAAAGADAVAATVRSRGVWSDATWNGTVPSPRTYHALAHDSARGKLVLFGGWSGSMYLGDTWEWDGMNWTQVATGGPPPRNYHSMAYDAARGRVVLFGGTADGASLGDTWEWDGATWTPVASAGPAPRSASAMMAYDAVRGQVVLFGGYGSAGRLGDTWAWDGRAWRQVAAAGPAARAEGAMAFDEGRGRLVLFGGLDASIRSLQDTWEWDGTVWTTTAGSAPPARYGHALAYDASRGMVVLFGGASGLTDTWAWNGTAWAQLPSTGPRGGPRMAYDAARRRLVIHGGYYSGALGDTHVLVGTTWTRAAAGGPPGRSEHALASDTGRGRVVLSGGRDTWYTPLPDTWEWNGTGWAQAASGGYPARYRHAMAYDAVRGRTVLLGGQNTGTIRLGDGYEWDGVAWTTIAVATPTARRWAAMAYDAGASRLVLFGGENGVLQDTWVWTGAGPWTQLAAAAPGPRQGHAMAFDALRNRTVLFGGTNTSTGADSGDTWSLGGSSWTVASTAGPGARSGAAIAYDGARHRVVLFGGYASPTRLGDTWEWDGTTWTSVAATGPTARFQHAMAYDAARDQVVLVGGNDRQGTTADTWLWSAPRDHQPALQLEVALSPFGVDPSRTTRVGVRAFAAGSSGGGGGAGATLWGWAHRGPANEPGTWVPLATNASGVAAAPASLVAWQSSSAGDARRFVLASDGLAFQVRPNGGAGDAPGGAAVALDYIEVRVRYEAP